MPIDFIQLVDKLYRRIREPLPGPLAHEPLRAIPTGAIRPKFEHTTPHKPGSVLILLYPDEGQIKFPLTLRPEYIGAHSGQVSLPGGKSEPGESAEETALREGEEEIGISRSNIKIVGRLTEFFVIPSNFMITPVVAFQNSRPVFTPDPVEVVRILEGSIEALLREDAVNVKEIIAARVYPLQAPHFLIENEIVWGATAMMLNELRIVLKESILN